MGIVSILKTLRYDYQASRVFPYLEYLITIFPFLALLIHNGRADPSIWLLAYVLPFVFANAAGFTYNTICDASMDSKQKNPITRGDLSITNARISLAILLVAAVLSFPIIYKSIIAIVLFLLFIMLWLTYSGLRARFKETVLAPPVASIVLWVGPPLVLMAEFNYFGIDALLILAGLFVVYMGHEIKHTVMDHDEDETFNCKTFAVIAGKKLAIYSEYLMLAIGFVLLLAGVYYVQPTANPGYFILLTLLFAAALAATMIYGFKTHYDYTKDVLPVTVPYIATKVFIIFYSLLLLQIPDILIIFIIWIYLMGKYP